MKFLKTIICCAILTLSLITPTISFASASKIYQETTFEYLGDGITVETTTNIYDSFSRTSTKRATSTSTYRDNGNVIATVTLDATFGYDGSSAWVSSASVSKSTSSGWTYSGENISTSGATARVTATLTKYSGNIAITTTGVNISLTCSKDGAIS